jgi:hypothetical protein
MLIIITDGRPPSSVRTQGEKNPLEPFTFLANNYVTVKDLTVCI